MGNQRATQRLATWAVVAAMLLLPGVALAQSAEFDPALRALVGRGVQETAPYAVGISGQAIVVAPPPVLLPTPTPGPVLVPTPTPGPVSSGDGLATYTSSGVTIQVPDDWQVDADTGEFYMDISPPTGDLAAVFLGGGADFPGVLGVVIIRDQAEALLGSFMEDTELVGVEVFYTDQGVPAVYIEFKGMRVFEPGTGAMIVYAPGNEAFLLLAFGPDEDWETYRADVEEIAETVTFDDTLYTLFTATEDTYFTDLDETLETLVLAGWHAVATGDEKLPLVVVEPGLAYIVALGPGENFDEDFGAGADLLRLLVQATAGSAVGRDLIAAFLDSIGGMSEDIVIDPTRTEIYTTAEGGTIRVVGTGALDEETSVNIAVYLDLRASGSLIMVVMGDLEQALEQEEELLLKILAETLILE